jgi:hypothetical protein
MSNLYNDFLNDCYGEVKIAGFTYDTSRALYLLDETAYRCGESEYFDSLVTDFFDASRDYERDTMLTDGERTQTAEAWAFEMLENDQPIDFDELTEVEQ